MPMRTSLALCALALTAVGLTACSTESQMRATDPAAADAAASEEAATEPGTEPAEMPTAVPAAEGPVATDGLVTVLDAGDGPLLCAGPVAASLPPQCTGPEISGWDWAEHPEFEDQGGTRWGSFHLTGTFDGTAFTVTEAIPAALYDTLSTPEDEPLGTPCEEPAGGWVVDESKTSSEAMDATLTAAATLPDYASAWLDDDIINVAVTGEPAAAEAALRETWGGALCVTQAERTQAELEAVQAELNALPGLLSVGSSRPDELDVRVLHDDGSFQQWVDQQHGEGFVTVSSALVPVTG